MKKVVFILIILVFSVFYSMGFLTKREPLPFSKDFFSVEGPSPSERGWELKKIFPLSKKTVDSLHEAKLDRGIRNLPILSYALIREAEKAIQDGDPNRGLELATYAIQFSPDLPQPYFELARARWHEGPFEFFEVLSILIKGQKARLQHYPSSVRLFYDTLYIFSNAILLTFMIFGIVVMIKYLPLYLHDVRRAVPQMLPKGFLMGLKILILFIPFFFRLDMLWAILFWSILLWGYVTRWEKRYILVFLIVLVYLPLFLRTFSSFLNSPSSDVLLRMYQANHEEWDKTTVERLKEWVSARPDDAEVLFTLGLIEKKRGRYSQAEEFYKKAIQREPEFSEAISNLGNVYMAQKQIQPAIASYQRAIHIDPKRGAYYYNLYRARTQETFLSSETDQIFQKARELDPALVDYYSGIDSANINRLVIDQWLTTSRLWKRFVSESIVKEEFFLSLLRGWFEEVPSRNFPLIPILFLGFLAGMFGYSRTRRFLARCPMCGVPTYRLYTGTVEKEIRCFNCHRIFTEKEKLHPRILERKSFQVKQFQKEDQLIMRFLSFFFLGFGYLWREQFVRGSVLLFLFLVLLLRLIYLDGVVPSAAPGLPRAPGEVVSWISLFALLYLVSLWQIFQFRPRVEIKKL
ncbi:MAG: tetratricopeptide repeat protein [Syntrophaceae bacterium]|nr:tetratricopeptide repeat protein [Syntrophaceae bacterium]